MDSGTSSQQPPGPIRLSVTLDLGSPKTRLHAIVATEQLGETWDQRNLTCCLNPNQDTWPPPYTLVLSPPYVIFPEGSSRPGFWKPPTTGQTAVLLDTQCTPNPSLQCQPGILPLWGCPRS